MMNPCPVEPEVDKEEVDAIKQKTDGYSVSLSGPLRLN